MNITIGTLIVLVFFGIPFAISIWFLVKIANVRLNKIKLARHDKKIIKKDIIKLSIVLIIALLIVLLAVFVFILAFVPTFLEHIPLVWKLILLFMLLTFYGIFTSIFVGLGDVVGAGGSAANTIKVLFSYICDVSNLNNHNKNTENKQIKPEKK